MERLPRLHRKRWAQIDYRHVIWSLVRKPGAFARYRWREELFPSLVFRRTYDALRGCLGERADPEYVRILYLAAAAARRWWSRRFARAAGSRRAIQRRAGAKYSQPRAAECSYGNDRRTGSAAL